MEKESWTEDRLEKDEKNERKAGSCAAGEVREEGGAKSASLSAWASSAAFPTCCPLFHCCAPHFPRPVGTGSFPGKGSLSLWLGSVLLAFLLPHLGPPVCWATWGSAVRQTQNWFEFKPIHLTTTPDLSAPWFPQLGLYQ